MQKLNANKFTKVNSSGYAVSGGAAPNASTSANNAIESSSEKPMTSSSAAGSKI